MYLHKKGKLNMNVKVPEFLQKPLNIKNDVQEDINMEQMNDEKPVVKVADIRERKISPIEKEALLGTIRGLDPEEIALVLDNIPTHYIMERINRELERGKLFEQAIQNAMQIQKGE